VAHPPGFPSGACRITAASSAILCGTGSAVAIQPRCEPGSRLVARGPLSLHNRSACCACRRFLVAQHPRSHRECLSGSKGALQPPAPSATWRAQLKAPRYGRDLTRVAARVLSVWRPTCPCGGVYSSAWRAACCSFVCRRNRRRQPAEHACSRAGSRAITRVLRYV
jgi:hypothetical protein